jgi:hypothetical protein
VRVLVSEKTMLQEPIRRLVQFVHSVPFDAMWPQSFVGRLPLRAIGFLHLSRLGLLKPPNDLLGRKDRLCS